MSTSVAFTSRTDSSMPTERSNSVSTFTPPGISARIESNSARDGTRDRDGVRPGLTLHREHDRAHAVVPARVLVVLDVVEHATERAELHGGAVAIRDAQRAELRRVRRAARSPAACTPSFGPQSTPVGWLTF